jgi:hypothetical protein
MKTATVRAMPMIRFHACIGILLLTTAGIDANASSLPILPPQTGSVSVNSNNPSNTVTDPSYATLQGASASLSTAPFVSLQAQVSDAAGVASQDAFASLDYYFAVVGGNPGDAVPVLVQTSLLVTATAYPTNASAAIYVGGFGGVSAAVCVGQTTCTSNQFSGTLAVNAFSGQAVEVFLTISAEEGYSYGGSAFASADPYIFVNPSFADAADYSIIVSDDVGNSLATTPLPTALPLLATGLGALGLLRWRRQRKNTAAITA